MLSVLTKVPNKNQMAWIKATVFCVCLIPLFRLIWLGVTDNLSANPIEFIERSTGYWALFMLLVTLSLTPVRLITGRTWQLQLRRMLGLFMFFYACLHITTYVWLDYSFYWADITKDIIKHPYVLVGFAAFVLSIPLAITSNNKMVQLLKSNWKKLHRLVYLIAILGVVHFWFMVKKDIREPLLFACILLVLLGIRIYYRGLSKQNKKQTGVSQTLAPKVK